jgi:hypothetical protein
MAIEITVGGEVYTAPPKLRHPESQDVISFEAEKEAYLAAAAYLLQIEGQTLIVKKTKQKKGGE